jgi:hypothetical protein
MPLIRPNDTTQLSVAFRRFCGKLEDCIRRDEADTQGFFTNNLNFNSLSALYRADAISSGLDTTLLSRNRGIFSSSVISDVRDKILSNSYGATMTNMKSTILCAFELTNRGQANRINKQQLYTFLFCLGFPTGLIAKIILNGNVGGVRNGILTHKIFATAMLISIEGGSNLDSIKKGFLGNENLGSVWENRFFTIASICYKVGGMNLFNKFVNCTDQKEVLSSVSPDYNARNLTKNLLCYGFSENNDVYRINTINLFQTAFEQQRGVRRTGQTLSRNATTTRRENIVILERETPSAPTPVETIILSTPNDAGTSQMPRTTATRQKVRDIPLKTTFGIEIEGSFMGGVDSVGQTSAQWNKLKSVLRDANFDADIVKSDGSISGQGKLGVRQEGREEEKKSYWKYKYDGSVHGGEPYEFASPILKGKNGVEQVKLICSAMRQAGFYSNATAGVHVHLGAKDLELDTFKNVCYNFTKFEPLIDMIVPADRRWSNAFFSESFSKYSDFENRLDRATTFDTLVNLLMGRERYFAVNLQAYYRFGTIEFRKLIGTNDDRLIIWYLYFLHYLLEASKKKRLTKFNLDGLQDILPAWAFSYFVDKVRQTSGYDIKYGFDIGARGSTGQETNTFSRGGDPMRSPLSTRRGQQLNRRNNDFSN